MEVHLSRLGFGLSNIAGAGNFAYQQTLIKTAIDCGITHFDAAPYYGSGDAEKILGDILLTCPETVTITTKYGLTPFTGGNSSKILRSALRPLFRRAKFLKKMATSMISKGQQPNQKPFEKGSLLTSIDASMKKLQRPIDIFLLHDADINFARNNDLIEELDEARSSGKTILTGISGSKETVYDVIMWRPETYTVGQLENNLRCKVNIKKLSDAGAKVITHRAIQGGLTDLTFLINKRPGFKRIWLREIGIDPSNSDLLSQVLIELALNENPNGTVLFSTTNVDRIKKIALSITAPILSDDGCRQVRRLFEEVYLSENKNN